MNAIDDILNEQVVDLIRLERLRQNAKWGVQHHPLTFWMSILGEEYGEACQQVNMLTDEGLADSSQLRKEIIQVAAVCLAILADDSWGNEII